MSELLTFENLIAFLTLAALEIVLGIDNIVFITILVGKLPETVRVKAMRLGLGLALFMRVGLLLGIKWIMGLTKPIFEVMNKAFSGRDLILLIGGLFLIAKSTHEIHDKLEIPDTHEGGNVSKRVATFGMTLIQIMLLDIVFSLDSVITAVGMADHVPIMIAAIITAVLVMMASAAAVGKFVEEHPTIKMLALSFLMLIGVMLVAEGFGKHIEKGYIYFAMGFSLMVEMLNLRMRKVRQPVHLHHSLDRNKLPEGM